MFAADSQPVPFPCPHCGRMLSAPAILQGTNQKCPGCKQLAPVPASSTSATATHPATDTRHATAPASPPAPAAPPIATGSPPPVVLKPPRQVPTAQIPSGTPSASSPNTSANPSAQGSPDDAELWGPGEAAPIEAQSYVPVHCRVCDTRMYATLSQVGSEVVCPDCGAKTKVKMVATKPGAPPPLVEPGEGYELHAAPPPVDLGKFGYGYNDNPAAAAEHHPDSIAAAARADQAARRARHRPPKNWMIRGVFFYPFQISIVANSLLVVCLSVAIYYLTRAIDIFSTEQLTAIFSVFGTAVVASLVAFAGGTLATMLLGIIEVSSDGQDKIQDELELMFAERIFRLLFVMAAGVYAAAPGVLIDYLAGNPESWNLPLPVNFSIAAAISIFLLLPWTQLSVLEASSMVVPLSFEVLRGAARNVWAWAAFYLVSFVVVMCAVGLIYLARFLFPVVDACWIAGVAVTTLVIYYRLLGRLAWYCAENTPPLEEPKKSGGPYEPLYP